MKCKITPRHFKVIASTSSQVKGSVLTGTPLIKDYAWNEVVADNLGNEYEYWNVW